MTFVCLTSVAHHLVEARLLVGAQQLEVRRRAGRHQPFAMTLGAMFGVDVAAAVGRRLRQSRRDPKQDRADEETDAQEIAHANACSHGSANTKIELCPRTAFAMLLCVSLSGPDDTDCPSPVKTITYCLPFTA